MMRGKHAVLLPVDVVKSEAEVKSSSAGEAKSRFALMGVTCPENSKLKYLISDRFFLILMLRQ